MKARYESADNLNSSYDCYENLVNAVFIQAYNDLVAAIRKAYRHKAKARSAPVSLIANDEHDKAKRAMKSAVYLADWMRDALPAWRDLDAQKIIDRAYKEAEGDAEALFTDGPKIGRKI